MKFSKTSAALFSILGLAAGSAGAIAMQTHAAGTSTSTTTNPAAINQSVNPRHARPAAAGTVTAINGNTITLTDKRSGTVYTLDATSATIKKMSAPSSPGTTPPTPTTIQVSDIAVGDNLMVQGTVSGTNITATNIIDGQFMGGHSPLGNDGNVTAINGNTITMQEEADEGGASYTVDATGAAVTKNGANVTLTDLKVGDKIFVQGTLTGTNVTATSISIGHPGGMGKFHHGPPMGE